MIRTIILYQHEIRGFPLPLRANLHDRTDRMFTGEITSNDQTGSVPLHRGWNRDWHLHHTAQSCDNQFNI